MVYATLWFCEYFQTTQSMEMNVQVEEYHVLEAAL